MRNLILWLHQTSIKLEETAEEVYYLRLYFRKKVSTTMTSMQWDTTCIAFLNIVSMIIGVCANAVIIISFAMYSKEKEVTERFLVSLSLADLLVCSVYQPLLIYRVIHPTSSQGYIKTMSFIGYGVMVASLNGLLAVTVDRFVSIYLPFKYVYWMTDRSGARIIAVSWIVAVVMAVLSVTEVSLTRIISYAYTATVLTIVPIFYCVIYRKARHQARRIALQCHMPSLAVPVARRPHISKAIRGVGLVLTTTIICWLPVSLFPSIAESQGISEMTALKGLFWCFTAASLNSCINPFIYYWQFAKFRRTVDKPLRILITNLTDRGSCRVPPA